MDYRANNGRAKSKGRISLDKLSDQQLILILRNNRYEDIGKKYGLAKDSIRNIINQRNLFKPKEGREYVDDEFSKDDYIKSDNAWMKSKERMYYKQLNK